MLLTILTIFSAIFYIIEGNWEEENARIARLGFAGVQVIFTASYCIGLYYHGSIKDSKGFLFRICEKNSALFTFFNNILK